MSESAVRPLPPRPDPESERKRAKQLLREARRGEPEAILRIGAQNRSLAGAAPEAIKLADAQLTVAREYGFRSWPLLVRYYENFERQRTSSAGRPDRPTGLDFHERSVHSLLAEHRDRRFRAAAMIGTFVPRLYGATLEEIFAAQVSEEEARLTHARQYGFGSWDELIADAERPRPDPWREAGLPRQQLVEALREGDVAALKRLAADHPEVLSGNARGGESWIGHSVAMQYLRDESPRGRAVLDWAQSLGIDVQVALNGQLLGWLGGGFTVDDVERLIGAGADPSWVAPNGYSVLEHAIQRYWNGDAVDALARHTKPKGTLFVACGLGRAEQMRRYFDRSGKLTARALRERPDIGALSGGPAWSLPDYEVILFELAFVAAVNGRAAALDVLLEAGFPIDYNVGMTLLSFGAANGIAPMVELLISRGASPHVRGWHPSKTALELVTGRFSRQPEDEKWRHILVLCGGDPDAAVREAEAKRKPPQPLPGLGGALAFATQDAARQGRATVGVENFLVGVMSQTTFGRDGGVSSSAEALALSCLSDGGVDLDRLRARYAGRILEALTNPVALPSDEALLAAWDLAVARAYRRRDAIYTWAVLYYALEPAENVLAPIIEELGGDVQKVKDSLEPYLS